MCRPAYFGGLELFSVRYKAFETPSIGTVSSTPTCSGFISLVTCLCLTLASCLTTLHHSLPPSSTLTRPAHSVTIKQWTIALNEANLTREIADISKFKPCRTELSSPGTDWSSSWRMCRFKGLGSDLTSFNFKLLHRLLVTKERFHRLTQATSPICSLCSQGHEDLVHAYFQCSYNQDVGSKLLHSVQHL